MISQIFPIRITSAPVGLQLTAAAALVGVAVVLPMVVHQIPAVEAIPWGARLLAMFVAPFLGVVLFRFHVALIPALVAPAINHLLFGSPGAAFVGLVTVELAAFTAVAFLLMKVNRRFWLTVPMAYLAAKAVSGGLIAWSGLFDAFAPAGSFVLGSIAIGLPGLGLLTGVHVLLVRGEERGEG